MYSLLVLGIIPGTDIQISFEAWLVMAAALGMWMYRNREQLSLRFPAPSNGPVHASQLHRRAY